tara:strand:+ start:2592 stop:3098 length:507 start_codon:yes stop_codon:yes gene_type:complete
VEGGSDGRTARRSESDCGASDGDEFDLVGVVFAGGFKNKEGLSEKAGGVTVDVDEVKVGGVTEAVLFFIDSDGDDNAVDVILGDDWIEWLCRILGNGFPRERKKPSEFQNSEAVVSDTSCGRLLAPKSENSHWKQIAFWDESSADGQIIRAIAGEVEMPHVTPILRRV